MSQISSSKNKTCLMKETKYTVQERRIRDKNVGGCNQKFPDWPPAARTANVTALCHQVQLYRYFVSQSSEFCRHNPLCCLSTSVYYCCCLFRYRLSPENFGYTFVLSFFFFCCCSDCWVSCKGKHDMRSGGCKKDS
jgi:hypothetical protein